MSYLVLHMDKFKRESLRGIQSHNRRERRSRSNPDIRHEKSRENYDLHQPEVRDYARTVQARIESLNLPKAVRKDAVVLCGLIVTSDLPFFVCLPPEEQRRFFEESRDFLVRFVGQENVISAMIHMDEKTPHMHFLHVPVTPDGRLNANAIYTRESLRRLQSEMPEHLQACGFRIERGVEQIPGTRRIHLNTREFKQEKEERERIAADNVKVLRHALDTLYAASELEEHLKGKIKEYEKQAREAERYLARNEELPEATLFNFKTVLAQARRVIEEQKKALAEKAILEGRKEIVDGLLAERNRELKEQARRIDRLRRELEELKKQKDETVDLRLKEAWCWLLVPSVDTYDRKTLDWERTRLSGGTDGIITRAAKKLLQNEWAVTKWASALLLMELDNLLWQGVNHLEIKQLWEWLCTYCYLPRLASYDVLEETITSGLCETEFFAYAAAVGEDRYISLKLGERVRPEKSGYLVKVKAAKTQMERVAQEEEERQRAEHERQQEKIGGSGTAGAGTAGVTGTTPDGTNTGGQTGGGGNAGGTQPEPEIITPPPASKSMSFYLSAQLDTTRVNRDVQKILEEVVSVLTQENGVTVELRFDVQASAPNGLQPSTIRAVSENCRTLKITNFGFVEE